MEGWRVGGGGGGDDGGGGGGGGGGGDDDDDDDDHDHGVPVTRPRGPRGGGTDNDFRVTIILITRIMSIVLVRILRIQQLK